MSTPEKYAHINFKPPQGARKEAEKSLAWRREFGRGGTAVGIARARDLANGVELSPSTVRRMKAFFDRHQKNKSAPGWSPDEDGFPSNSRIAWAMWGSDAGWSWAKKVVEQMNAADEKEQRGLRPYGSTHGMRPKVYVVHGAPCSGKKDYVAKHLGENDVVFDYDEVMAAVSGRPIYEPNRNLVSYCLDIRTLILKKALQRSGAEKTWIITTRVGDDMKSQLSDIPVKYVHIDTPKDECLQRLEQDEKRQPLAQELRQVIEEYFKTGDEEQRRAPLAQPGVERRYIGNFGNDERLDPELLRIEKRSDPETGKPRTYIIGYAARFHSDSLLLGDFVEQIDPGAFEIVTNRRDEDGKPLETRCLFNHDPNYLLGRFPTTMRMVVDDKGLKYECLLPEAHSGIAESIARGDLKGSSVSFVVSEGGERWTTENGQSRRIVTKVKAILDCGPVTYPAYSDSSVSVAKRSYEQFAGKPQKPAAEKRKQRLDSLAKRAEVLRARITAEAFLAERRDCGRVSSGRFGSNNNCAADDGGSNISGGGGSRPKTLEQQRLEAAGEWDDRIDPFVGAPYDGGDHGGFIPDLMREVAIPGTNTKTKIDVDDPDQVKQFITLSAKAAGVSVPEFMKSKRFGGTLERVTPDDKVKLFGGTRQQYTPQRTGGWGNKEDDQTAKQIGSMLRAANIKGATLASAVREYAKKNGRKPKDELYSGLVTFNRDPREFMQWARKRLDSYIADGKRSLALPSELSRRDCGRGEDGKFGSGNKCQEDEGEGAESQKSSRPSPKSEKGAVEQAPPLKDESPKYMELSGPVTPTKAKAAQKFIDSARKGQLERGGKDKGKSDDGSGVQTWSKGDSYPWTAKQVGDSRKGGYVQAQHPDGTKTKKYEFPAGSDGSDAYRKAEDEIKAQKKKRGERSFSETAAELRAFLEARR
jgi:HK97 family phage prohead protease